MLDFILDFTAGERTWAEIAGKMREAERMILICSARSLVRDGILKEIEMVIDDNPDKIIPISLDDVWRDENFKVRRAERNLRPYIDERNRVDFSNEAHYKASFKRLLNALARNSEK